MSLILAGMISKDWTGVQVRGLADLAKRKGYSKGDVAMILGVSRSTFSDWLLDEASRRNKLSSLARHALSWVEHWFTTVPDKITIRDNEPAPAPKKRAAAKKPAKKGRAKK